MAAHPCGDSPPYCSSSSLSTVTRGSISKIRHLQGSTGDGPRALSPENRPRYPLFSGYQVQNRAIMHLIYLQVYNNLQITKSLNKGNLSSSISIPFLGFFPMAIIYNLVASGLPALPLFIFLHLFFNTK